MSFQSTLPREERPKPFIYKALRTIISIHAPTRGATPIVYHFLFIYVFQSTLPREERHIIPINGAFVSYFNPRSHERSDKTSCHLQKFSVISIHAPTRGATDTPYSFSAPFTNFNPRSHERSDNDIAAIKSMESISIHAPTRGATNNNGIVDNAELVFQSTLPREERLGLLLTIPCLVTISIHAPTRGATVYFVPSVCLSANFNPRSHERSDLSKLPSKPVPRNFNPRSHERSDSNNRWIYGTLSISIHAPTRGATLLMWALRGL